MTDLADRARQLRERLDQGYADGWDFKAMPVLVGIVESYARVDTAYGARVVCTLREVEPPENRYAVWLSQTALLERFKELRPAQGELVAIRYLGQADHAERGRNPAHRFRVEVDRPGASFEWSQLEADDEPPVRTRATPLDAEEHAAAMERYAPPPDDSDIPY